MVLPATHVSFLVHCIGLPVSRVSLPCDGISLKRALERQEWRSVFVVLEKCIVV